MTGNFLLDWAVLALSLANTILLVWLGTTVLFNAERHTWGGWLAAAGLLLGGVFFVSHTFILGYGFNNYGIGLNLWWSIGLLAVMVLPCLWYVMMLWYSGFWQTSPAGKTNELTRRHRPWLLVAAVLMLSMFVVALFTRSAPEFASYPARGITESVQFNGIPVILMLYPLYVIVCLGLSLDALRDPGPASRLLGERARQRARPWLVGATLALLGVSLAVGAVFLWLSQYLSNPAEIFNEHVLTIGWFDLLISALICLAVVLLGQAVVAYEVFTGKTLPRQGFMRQWQRAVILALGYGTVIGFTVSTPLRPIYGVLLSALLMTFFFALLSWREYTERERTMESLRPFVASQRFYDQLLTPAAGERASLQPPFDALCSEVLNTRLAYMVPLGPLAPLVGPPLSYPSGQPQATGRLAEIASQLTPATLILRLEDNPIQGILWAVPLWSQRGLAGLLLLGEKNDSGIYSQEEIEVAQASCERLIDTQASVEIAQRLMGLQRQRLAESQVVDQRARRVLHDEVLQQMHTAMLLLASAHPQADAQTSQALDLLAGVHNQISNLLRAMPSASLPVIAQLGLVSALRQAMEDEFSSAFNQVGWEIEPQAEQVTAQLTPIEAEVLYYAAREAARNAAKHGSVPERVTSLDLAIRMYLKNGLNIEIEDNGIGMPTPDFEQETGGQGLALHSTMMAVIGGELAVESEPNHFTRVRLSIPEVLRAQ